MSHPPPLPSPADLAALPPDGGPAFNRLVFESSPYLRLHARNPVDWFPWGEAAFAKARSEDKPVLLSVGYSTCHWCHVMARECFEDAEVAALLNANYISIKVDREERPDVDEIYMTATQALTGHGGWPMTVIMAPDRRPFFAGTYFPKHDRAGRPGFLTVLRSLDRLWRHERPRVADAAAQITALIAETAAATPGAPPGPGVLDRARDEFAATFDPDHGGFGRGTKFPTPQVLSFLTRQWRRDRDPATRAMAEETLAAIRHGGVYDQLGHGIHRYATDPRWELPHFEKMLYDQALYVLALLDAHQAAGSPADGPHARTARDVLGYVRRVLTAPDGGFFSAEDAQSEGVEGKFYLWTPDEVRDLLGPGQGDASNALYQIRPGGNFREESTGRLTGESIPRLPRGADPAAVAALEPARAQLFAARERRPKPPLDDKVLTDWNGLMIAAMARAARALAEPQFLTAASRAARFALDHLRTPDGRLLKRWRQGEAGLPAHLEDYAFLAWGLIELHQASRAQPWLDAALALTRRMIDDFADPADGGFFMTAADAEAHIVRPKKLYGGAIPSGNEVAALNFTRLAALTGDDSLATVYQNLLTAFAGQLDHHPSAFPVLLQALDFATAPPCTVTVTGRPDSPDTAAILSALDRAFLPHVVLIFEPADTPATARLCQGSTCQAPTSDPAALLAQLIRPPAP